MPKTTTINGSGTKDKPVDTIIIIAIIIIIIIIIIITIIITIVITINFFNNNNKTLFIDLKK